MGMIVSASRRTDVPRWYADWFFKRLDAGYALSQNPMNARQVRRVELSPEAVDCFVFWSKDPAPMLGRLAKLRGYAYYFQFTLNAYGADVEANIPAWADRVETFRRLAGEAGPERVVWRYDPIVLNETYTEGWHARLFERTARALRGSAGQCMFSFLDRYKKTARALGELGVREPDAQQKAELAARLLETAGAYGLRISACCEPGLEAAGIPEAHCIDAVLIERITGSPCAAKKDANQRPGCGCAQSVDIGMYDTCPGGCAYCYANRGGGAALRNHAAHNAAGETLR